MFQYQLWSFIFFYFFRSKDRITGPWQPRTDLERIYILSDYICWGNNGDTNRNGSKSTLSWTPLRAIVNTSMVGLDGVLRYIFICNWSKTFTIVRPTLSNVFVFRRRLKSINGFIFFIMHWWHWHTREAFGSINAQPTTFNCNVRNWRQKFFSSLTKDTMTVIFTVRNCLVIPFA